MKLHSSIKGQGPDLLILHGLFGMSDNWNSLGRKWSDHYTVHLLDLRNHGRSPHSNDFSYEVMAEDLRGYFASHKINKAHLIGHSMGGKVAMLFAALHPDKVKKLVIADIGPKAYPPHHQTVIKALQNLKLEELESRSEAEENFSEKLDQGTRQFLLKNLYWQSKNQLAWRFNLSGLVKNIEAVGESLPNRAYYDGPLLFIRGGASDYILEADLDLIYQHFPEAKLATIPEAGHWLHAQKPKEFYQQATQFLGD
jgi:pimeloyl-ACP methyl ester carboxylesterase